MTDNGNHKSNGFFGISTEEINGMEPAARSELLQRTVDARVPSRRFLANSAVLLAVLTAGAGAALAIVVTRGFSGWVVALQAVIAVYFIRKARDVVANTYLYGSIVARVETHNELTTLIATQMEERSKGEVEV